MRVIMDKVVAPPKGSASTIPTEAAQGEGLAGFEGADRQVLGHLLQIEAEAAALVDDAQAEADRRIAEGERQNRARYDEQYGREAAELEQGYDKEVAAVKADYQHQIDGYRKSLDAITVNRDRFSALMDALLNDHSKNDDPKNDNPVKGR
jgi:F0F1-type ATP synthase membrane subunit b/b'